MRHIALLFSLMLLTFSSFAQKSEKKPMRIAIVGLTHDHVQGIFNRLKSGDFELVGIAEPNKELVEKYLKRNNLTMSIAFDDLETMLDQTKPEAVCAFNDIREHLEVVELCAPRGIHVMVEKPLAVNLEHARRMEKLAQENHIQLLTNFETTWYPSHHEIKKRLETEKQAFGDIRKMVIHDGHQGPKEIGVSKEFFAWLTNPFYNGGGALTDFGCYGANLSTWLHDGQKPIAVTAVTQQIKPEIYPNVDDEATIIVTYPKSQSIIQASWNWNYGRKDMEVYTQRGYLHALNRNEIKVMRNEKEGDKMEKLEEMASPKNDAFKYFMAVIREEITPKPSDLSSLENNMTVMEILQAAMISSKEGRTVKISDL